MNADVVLLWVGWVQVSKVYLLFGLLYGDACHELLHRLYTDCMGVFRMALYVKAAALLVFLSGKERYRGIILHIYYFLHTHTACTKLYNIIYQSAGLLIHYHL